MRWMMRLMLGLCLVNGVGIAVHGDSPATKPAQEGAGDSWMNAVVPAEKAPNKPPEPVSGRKNAVPSPAVATLDIQDQVLFPYQAAPRNASPVLPAGTEVLKREIDAGAKVEAWFVPYQKASDKAPAPLAVICHGNAEVIDQAGPMIRELRAMGWSVLAPEYRGYGRSGGRPSQDAIRDDLTYFLDEVLKRPDVDAKRVVYIGRSLGGGVAADLATVRKPAALVLISTFTSVVAMSRNYMIPADAVKYPFRTDKLVREFEGPVLVFHGDHDSVIPVTHGRELAQMARQGKYVELRCNHNDFPGADSDSRKRFLWEFGLFMRKAAQVGAAETQPAGSGAGAGSAAG